MNKPISKTDFKAHALAVLREVERTGEPRIITDRGKPTLEIRKLRYQDAPPQDKLRGTVVNYVDPMEPVDDDAWTAAL